jgi:carboxyl-terminal processing protease
MRNRFFRKNWLLILVFSITVGLFSFTPTGEKFFLVSKNLDIFASLFKELNLYYVDEINPNSLVKTSIDGMLSSLDPYTNYIPEDDIEDYRTMTTGQYGGIGAVIGKRNGKTLVLMPYENYPAAKAGLKIGDEILQVDGIIVKDKSSADVSKYLKGQKDTKVKVLVQRYGESSPREFTVNRVIIKIDNVPYYGMVTEDIGYIVLTDFTVNASGEVRNAVNKLKAEGAKKLIFDLRDNPGGLLSEAVDISNLFIPKDKEVVSTKGKVAEWNKAYTALNPPLDTQMPMAILTNSRSASASEIVAGVIQDYDRGVLIGQKSFGKGLVQTTRQLSYNSQLKVTTAKYYIPSGRCIQAVDYSHRNEDGSVGAIPDSLKTSFKTKNGRLVYDGGGVTPDIPIEQGLLAPITQSLINKGLLFDFATHFASKNPSIPPAKDFQISDQLYAEFTQWLQGKEYDYVTKVENNLKQLEEAAKLEKYYDSIKEGIDALRNKVSHNKDQDLQLFKEEVKRSLKEEIVSRYYFQKGVIESSFTHDDEILAAVSALNDSAKYSKILAGK